MKKKGEAKPARKRRQSKYDAFALRTVKVVAKRGADIKAERGHELHATLRVQSGYAPKTLSAEARGCIHLDFWRYENARPSSTLVRRDFDIDISREELESTIEALEAFRDVGDEAKVWE